MKIPNRMKHLVKARYIKTLKKYKKRVVRHPLKDRNVNHQEEDLPLTISHEARSDT